MYKMVKYACTLQKSITALIALLTGFVGISVQTVIFYTNVQIKLQYVKFPNYFENSAGL